MADWVWFVSFDTKEVGLVGAKAFLASLPYQAPLRDMVNFDMVGKQEPLLVSGDRPLTELAKEAVPSVLIAPDRGVSDHFVFRAKDIPVLMITRGMFPDWHSPADATIDPALLDQTVDAAEQILYPLLDKLILEPESEAAH